MTFFVEAWICTFVGAFFLRRLMKLHSKGHYDADDRFDW